MNKKLGLAVAGALVAFSSAANAGISIPAGDWTLDIGGVVNAYYTNTKTDGVKSVNNITTGLLPNVLSVSGKTRQNDLDVAFTISLQPGAATSNGLANYSHAEQENRQAFLTVGDASWGSVKFGKDLGIYASDAILNDMTLLGVGAGASAVGTTTLGRIGGGYIYADWKSQIAYTSPNWNGFQFTAGVTQAWNTQGDLVTSLRGGAEPAFEGKASYAFTADQVTGKVWVSGISQNVQLTQTTDDRASAWDIGANVNVAGFGLTGYYGQGSGLGTVVQFKNGYNSAGQSRDSEDWYVQGTYTVPTIGTKLGVSYGESSLDGVGADTFKDKVREQWTIGAYHPLTKSVNLVAEYTNLDSNVNNKSIASTSESSKTVSLGAILFF
jgi:predicted porin